MAPADQQAAPARGPRRPTCANCGAAMAPDQRYCLACGARRGEPRVPLAPPPAEAAGAGAPPRTGGPPGRRLAAGGRDRDRAARRDVADRRADRSRRHERRLDPGGDHPGRRGHRQHDHNLDLRLGRGSGTPPAAVTSEWPAGTDGFTVQLTSLPKSSATPESVDSAKQSALDDGAPRVAVLDSDLYSSLPAGDYVIYSGVYDSTQGGDRRWMSWAGTSRTPR